MRNRRLKHIPTLQTAQIGTQPMLTASSAAYPLINAANQAAKCAGNNLSPTDIKKPAAFLMEQVFLFDD
ncbi:MAG: hypothetical protein K9J27_00675 [Bacteroidales bacterium]|nr:hypothetical protein [Bacteroidales bacterium]MCF8333114.1 hypothetical protein [Bacteroidales bacterium]